MAGSTDELGISHRTIEVNGISMHVAEKGEGPAVLFVHGFPELWYSWRHQIVGLAERGYRAIAPDLRGYGDTSATPEINSYTYFHIVGDLVALLDAVDLPQVFVVGHDWGAIIAWHLSLFRPDKVKALVNLSVVYQPRDPNVKTVDSYQAAYGDDYYIVKFQEPGVIEADFARLGTEYVLTKFFSNRDPGPIIMNEKEFLNPNENVELPSWLSQQDLDYYVSNYNKSGFTGPVNYYRCFNLSWELTAPWTGAKIKVPVKFIVGDLDLTYHLPGVQDYINNGGFKETCPLLEEVIVVKGAAHFIQQERVQEITDHIYEFFKKF